MADSARSFAGMDVITISAAVRPGAKAGIDGLYRAFSEWLAAEGIEAEAWDVHRRPWSAGGTGGRELNAGSHAALARPVGTRGAPPA
jgi:hypothetical protein